MSEFFKKFVFFIIFRFLTKINSKMSDILEEKNFPADNL